MEAPDLADRQVVDPLHDVEAGELGAPLAVLLALDWNRRLVDAHAEPLPGIRNRGGGLRVDVVLQRDLDIDDNLASLSAG
jgi:hypothetical protein